MEITIALVQYKLQDISQPKEFEEQISRYFHEALEKNPHIIVFPELITTQLASIEWKNSYDAVRELDEYTERYLAFFTELALKHQVHILGGSHIVQKESGVYVNRAYLFYPDSTYLFQDKIHLTPWENYAWQLKGGEQLCILPTQFGKIGILTCYDIEFPELARKLAEEGVTMIFSPSCTASEQGLYRVIRCAQARAVENQLFVMLTGTLGVLERLSDMQSNFTRAGIYSPCDTPFPVGGVIAEGELNQEMIVTGKINLNALNQVRVSSYAALLKDQRRDFYQVQFLKANSVTYPLPIKQTKTLNKEE